jgi:integrase/recombinase XerD
MQEVYHFCLYRRRTELQCFVPDRALFPRPHQNLQPYIFSAEEVAKLLRSAAELKRVPSSPLRPEVIRLAIVLLFTTGIRCGELLRLTLDDYDRRNAFGMMDGEIAKSNLDNLMAAMKGPYAATIGLKC